MNISSGDPAVFNCTATATFINWEVNGAALNADLMSKGFDNPITIDLNVLQDLRMSKLGVLGSPDNDNISIVCVAVLRFSATMFVSKRSDPALLLVQGMIASIV